MPWQRTALTELLGVRLPIIQAPMAGGPTTPRLVAAVSEAGGLGSLAASMLGPDELRTAIRQVRALTTRPFAVNLFAPLPPPSMERVAEWAALTGRPAPERPPRLPRYADQMDVVASERVPVYSFTFGIPPLDGVAAVTIGTATTVEEALACQRAGVSVVVAQGFEAGGHRGSFLRPAEHSMVGTLALVPQVVDAVSVPVVASGGVMDGRGIAAALALGASGVQLGTAFLLTDEAGTTEPHRAAVASDTTMTDVLTGRYARAARTSEVERLEAAGVRPPDYPVPRAFLDGPAMLMGQGGPMARRMPAGDLVATLAAETDAVLARLGASDRPSGP